MDVTQDDTWNFRVRRDLAQLRRQTWLPAVLETTRMLTEKAAKT